MNQLMQQFSGLQSHLSRHQAETVKVRNTGTRDQQMAERGKQVAIDTLAVMSKTEARRSIDIGRAMGVNRTTGFKRLCVLESQGLVLRVGHGVDTKWVKL